MEVVNCIKVAIDSSSLLTTYSLLHIDWDRDNTCNSLQTPLSIQSYFPALSFFLIFLIDWLTVPVSTTDGAAFLFLPFPVLVHLMPLLIPCWEDCYPRSQHCFHPHYYYFTVTLFLLLALFCPLNRSALHGRSSTLTLSLASEALCQMKQNCEIILLMNKINQSTSYNKRFGSIIIMIALHAPGSPSWWHNGSTRHADSPWLIMMMIDCLKCLDCVHQ